MYLVPMEIPNFCNDCPFGFCNYSLPLHSDRVGEKNISKIDGKENKRGTFGYTCNVDFAENERYTKILRANCGEDIPKPEWCGLRECEGKNNE